MSAGPSRLMLVGDLHGNTMKALDVVRSAASLRASEIVQLGDFGLWDHEAGGTRYLDVLDEALERAGLRLTFVPGNHENWDRLYDVYGLAPHATAEVRPSIRAAGPGWTFDLHGWRFATLGGATSIDVDAWGPRQSIAMIREPGRNWWPAEQISDADVRAVGDAGKVDVLLLHEPPRVVRRREGTIPEWTSVPSWVTPATAWRLLDSSRHIDAAIAACEPQLIVHGHMHEEYTGEFQAHSHVGDIIGLGADCSGSDRLWIVIEADLDRIVLKTPLRGRQKGDVLLSR